MLKKTAKRMVKRIESWLGIELPRAGQHKAQIARIKADLSEVRYLTYASLPAERRKEALQFWWRIRHPGTPALDLDHPRTFCEKIQVLKLHGDDPLLTRLADKFAVREWVANRIGERYLVPLIGAWDAAEDIDFDALPDRFVLKANHGSHWNVVVKDKSKLDRRQVLSDLSFWLKLNYAYVRSFQMQYDRIPRKIIAEEFMENASGDLYDYKFWCFKGKVHYVQYLANRKERLRVAFFDRDWNVQPFMYNRRPKITKLPPRPSNLEEMIALAEKLADGFEFVRVDFYRLDDGTIKFGEMTFTPANGGGGWEPEEWDVKLGALFDVRRGNLMSGDPL